MSKEKELWDAVQTLESEVEELKTVINYAMRLTVSLAGLLGYQYKVEEKINEDGSKQIIGHFEERKQKSHLILP